MVFELLDGVELMVCELLVEIEFAVDVAWFDEELLDAPLL